MRRRIVIALTALALPLAAVVWINGTALREAYGDGPPHYGRTTNMDKWADPLPLLVPIDAVSLALIGAAAWWVRRSLSAASAPAARRGSA